MGSTPAIMIVGGSVGDLQEVRRAFAEAGVANPLHSMRSIPDAKHYLGGRGVYGDRMTYPVPSVILLDLEQEGSFELLGWIRDQFPSGGLLLVALTSFELIHQINRAYSLGANSFLTKPVRAAELNELISIFGGYWLLQRFPFEEQRDLVALERTHHDS